jgi:hypothetical protein
VQIPNPIKQGIHVKIEIQQLIERSYLRTSELHKAASELFDRYTAGQTVNADDVLAYQAQIQVLEPRMALEEGLRSLLKTEIARAEREQIERGWDITGQTRANLFEVFEDEEVYQIERALAAQIEAYRRLIKKGRSHLEEYNAAMLEQTRNAFTKITGGYDPFGEEAQ